MQYKRTAAWNQVQQAEEEAELVLGMDKDEFTRIMGSVFHEFDADQSGFLDPEEFERAIAGCGIPFSPSQIRMLMAAADVNEDGVSSAFPVAHILTDIACAVWHTHGTQHTQHTQHTQRSCKRRGAPNKLKRRWAHTTHTIHTAHTAHTAKKLRATWRAKQAQIKVDDANHTQ